MRACRWGAARIAITDALHGVQRHGKGFGYGKRDTCTTLYYTKRIFPFSDDQTGVSALSYPQTHSYLLA